VPNKPSDKKSFWMHTMALLACEAQVESHFNPFRDSGILDARQVHSLSRT
jgi:hypothetical protein